MKKTIILLSICLMQLVLVAQTALNGAGGEATGIGGKMSFSIGEVAYTSISNSNFTITQGVQQPYISPFNYSVNASDYNVCAGQAVTLSVNTVGSYRAGTVHCNATPTAVVDVTNPITGKTWMDRNLGASQVATSSTDAQSYGDLYQWGRGADGHQCRNSATTSTLSSTDQPGHSDFILPPGQPWNWRNPQNINLWQGVNGVNNACPSGYRLPTDTELNAERLSWIQNNSVGAFASPLKLPMAGYRDFSFSDDLGDVGSHGYYWSSTVSGAYSRGINFHSSHSGMLAEDLRANGNSVRCIKN